MWYAREILYTYFFIALVLNLIWENLHATLYENFNPIMAKVFFLYCSIVDALITLLIYFLVTLLRKNFYWIKSFTVSKNILATLLVSILTATVMEKTPVALGFWSYTSEMSVLPVLEIGLSPFLQISLLPLFTFFLAYLLVKKGKRLN